MNDSIESYRKYIGLVDAEVDALREARPHIELHAEAFIECFYAHLKAFEGTQAFLKEDVLHRLLTAQLIIC